MPDKTYPGPFKGSRYTQYKKDPVKGYSRDLILKSGVVHHDTSGEFSKETQERKRRSRANAEKQAGWASKDGLENLGKGLMITGGATGATLAWGGTQYIKKLKRDAAERAYKQQDQAGRSASLAKGRDRTLPSATRQQINDAVTRNPDAPKDTSVRKDMGGGRRVRPVAGTPRIRLTQEQINERVARTRKGTEPRTEPMAERAPITPRRRVLNEPPPGSTAPTPPKTRTPKVFYHPETGKPLTLRPGDNPVSQMRPRPEGKAPGVAVNRNPITTEQQKEVARARNARSAPASASTPTPPARTPKVFYHPETGKPLTPRTTPSGRPGVRSGQGMQPRPEGKAPGVAVNRNPITAEQQQAIARARNARRTPASTSPTPSGNGGKPGGTGGFRAGANGAAEAAARNSAYPPRTGASSVPPPQFGPTPTGTKPYVPPGQNAVPTFSVPGAAKTAEAAATAGKGARFMSGLKRFGKVGGTVAGVAAGLAGASELYDRLAPKDWARAPWMSRGKEPVRAPQVTQEQPFTPSPGGTASTGGNKGGGSGGGSTMTQQARASQRAIRKPDDYLGEAFDATLRKGVDKGTAHLEHMMKMDNLDEDTRAGLRNRFKKVQNDKILSQQKDKGIVERLDAEKAGRGENLLKAYRKEGGFNYGKGGKYEEIKRLAEAGTEYAK